MRARDFRRELEERERVAVREKTRERGPRGKCSFGFATELQRALCVLDAVNKL